MSLQVQDTTKSAIFDYMVDHPKTTKFLTYTLFALGIISIIIGILVIVSSLSGGPVFTQKPLIGCLVGAIAIGSGISLLFTSYSLVGYIFNYFQDRVHKGLKTWKAPNDGLRLMFLPSYIRDKLCFKYL
jgi:hypothetical protein